jgi:hypothetical protein
MAWSKQRRGGEAMKVKLMVLLVLLMLMLALAVPAFALPPQSNKGDVGINNACNLPIHTKIPFCDI